MKSRIENRAMDLDWVPNARDDQMGRREKGPGGPMGSERKSRTTHNEARLGPEWIKRSKLRTKCGKASRKPQGGEGTKGLGRNLLPSKEDCSKR